MSTHLNKKDRYLFVYALAHVAQGGASILVPLYIDQVLPNECARAIAAKQWGPTIALWALAAS